MTELPAQRGVISAESDVQLCLPGLEEPVWWGYYQLPFQAQPDSAVGQIPKRIRGAGRPRSKGECGYVEEDSRISSWGTKVEGRQELQARLPTPQRAEGQCGPWKMNKEGYGRKEQQRRTSPRMHSSQQGVSAGGRASRCSEQSRLKAEM